MNHEEVTLPNPITQGDKTIETLTIRKPVSGDMRGLKTLDVLNMDINSHAMLVPRLCPELNKNLFYQLEPENLIAVQMAVTSFFTSAVV